MIYDRRYIQFNDLVFDGYDMISDWNDDVDFKGNTTDYEYGHGAYIAFKRNYMYASERSVSMTITLKMKKIPCEYREFYPRFAEEELSKPGKLWSVKNNELQWAVAYAKSISHIQSLRNDVVILDVEFIIPSGVWNKANKQMTYLVPYSPCTLMECKGYKHVECEKPECADNCCEDCLNKAPEREDNCYCCCEDLTWDMALCFHQSELQAFYSCETPYQIVYKCGDYYGKQFSTDCDGTVIAGRYYSETDIPTDEVTLTLEGQFFNPIITINGNTNIIKGEYDGILTIHPNGDVYYGDECCERLLEPSVWKIPKGNDYGWTINPRWNRIKVDTNTCCYSSVYVLEQAKAI